ncbi:hypothetical protein [Massilia sp. BJB1822]|uniref:hypothetical protein n=1 Tax=Massilia sp. BJB1822 TaxID=2744470 RepID=UPI001593AE7A|nr:hypothetical protein [Massilia sp. BJB1822]NVD99433.1 hypothetical protein [Massilia sp. BJB1822]
MFPAHVLLELARYLAARGIPATADQLLGARHLLQLHGATPQAAQLGAWLSPVFCKSAEHQERFVQLVHDWQEQNRERSQDAPASHSSSASAETAAVPAAGRRKSPSWLALLPLLALLAAALTTLVLLYLLQHRHFSLTLLAANHPGAAELATSMQADGVVCAARRAQAGVFDCAAKPSAFPLALRVRHGRDVHRFTAYPDLGGGRAYLQPAQLPALTVKVDDQQSAAPAPASKPEFADAPRLRQAYTVLPPAEMREQQEERLARSSTVLERTLTAALLFGLAFGLALVYLRRQAVLTRRSAPLEDKTAALGGAAKLPRFALLPATRRYALALRNPLFHDGRRLNPASTVAASSRRAGLFTPVYGERRERRFLAFVQRSSLQDHQAFIGEAMVEELLRSGVDLQAFRFSPGSTLPEPFHPRQSAAAQRPAAALASFEHIVAANPGAECLFLCQPQALCTANGDQLAPWFERLQELARCTLLTLDGLGLHSHAAVLLRARGVILCGTDATAMQRLAALEARQGLGREAPAQPPERNDGRLYSDYQLYRHAPAADEIRELCQAIRGHLGHAGMRWVQACAVYPVLQWPLTLALGQLLIKDGTERERLLMRLSTLVWFRLGHMPDWLRRGLSEGMEAGLQALLRSYYWQLFSDGLGAAPLSLEYRAAGGSPRQWLQTARALWRERHPAARREQLFVRFLLGHDGALDLPIPQRISRGLQLWAGEPRTLAAACCAGLAVSSSMLLWQPEWARQSQAAVAEPARLVQVRIGRDQVVLASYLPAPHQLSVITGSFDSGRLRWEHGMQTRVPAPLIGNDIPSSLQIAPDLANIGVSDGYAVHYYGMPFISLPLKANADDIAPISSRSAQWFSYHAVGLQTVEARESDSGMLALTLSPTFRGEGFGNHLLLPRAAASDGAIRRIQFLFGGQLLVETEHATKISSALATQLPHIPQWTASLPNIGVLSATSKDNLSPFIGPTFAQCYSSGKVRVWQKAGSLDGSRDPESLVLTSELSLARKAFCTSIMFVYDKQYLLLGMNDGSVHLLNLKTSKTAVLELGYPGKAAVADMSLNYDSKVNFNLAVARQDLSVSLASLDRYNPHAAGRAQLK